MNYEIPQCYYNGLLIRLKDILKKEENKNNEDLKSLANSIMCLVNNKADDTQNFSMQVYTILDKQGYYDDVKKYN